MLQALDQESKVLYHPKCLPTGASYCDLQALSRPSRVGFGKRSEVSLFQGEELEPHGVCARKFLNDLSRRLLLQVDEEFDQSRLLGTL